MEPRIKLTSGVPRGFLQFLVLKFLLEKDMSGVEIVEEIEQETNGRWKPSSGSIYPLLARLQEKGYTCESPRGGSGLKRYLLTDEGKKFFEEQVRVGQKFLEKLEWLAPMFIGGFQFGINHKSLNETREAGKRVLKTFIDFRTIRDNLTKQDVEEIVNILNDCDKKLKKITRRIKEKKHV